MSRVSPQPSSIQQLVKDDGFTMPPARPFFRRSTPSSPTVSAALPTTVPHKKHRVPTSDKPVANGVVSGGRKVGPQKVLKKKTASTDTIKEKDDYIIPSHSSNTDTSGLTGMASSASSFPAPPRLQRLSPLDELEAEIARSYQQELEQLMFGNNSHNNHHHDESMIPATTKHHATNPSPPPCHHHFSPHGLSPSPEPTTAQQQPQHGHTTTVQRMVPEDDAGDVDNNDSDSDMSNGDCHYDLVCVDQSVGADDGLVKDYEEDASPTPGVPVVVEDQTTLNHHPLQLPSTVTDKLQLYRQLWQQRRVHSPLNMTATSPPSSPAHHLTTTSTPLTNGRDAVLEVPVDNNNNTMSSSPTTLPVESVTTPFHVEEICVEDDDVGGRGGSSSPVDSVGSSSGTAPSMEHDDMCTGISNVAGNTITAPQPIPPTTSLSTTPPASPLLPQYHHHHHHRLVLEMEVVRRLSFEAEECTSTTALDDHHSMVTTTTATTTRVEDEHTTTATIEYDATTTTMTTPTRPLLFDDTTSDEDDGDEGRAKDDDAVEADTIPTPQGDDEAATTPSPTPTPLFNDEEEWCIADGQRTAGEVALSELHISDPPAAASTSPLSISPLLDPQSWLYSASKEEDGDGDDDENADGAMEGDASHEAGHNNQLPTPPPTQHFGTLDRYNMWVVSSMTAVPPPLHTTGTGASATRHLTNKCGRILTIPAAPIHTTINTRPTRRRRPTPTPSSQVVVPPLLNKKVARVAQGGSDVGGVVGEASFTAEAELHWAATLDVYIDMQH